ncbi:MAG: glycosyltransferase family 2 protein [Lachnospiraceae bacterium]|nr:glycosyltransferase family 2 protein [Lachnospiraceae bacterium]
MMGLNGKLASIKYSVEKNWKRVKNLGGPKGFFKKLNSRILRSKAQKRYGTVSFPDAERIKAERETVFERKIVFSILVPLYNTPEIFLREMIDSVLAQTYEGWELCLADGSDAEHNYVERIVSEYREKDSRIVYKRLEKNAGISENTNACYELASGDYIGLFDHDDLIHPSVLYEYMKVICGEGADFLYCDETTFTGKSINKMITPHFKPDFSPDNLSTNNYICHFSVFTRELAESIKADGRLFRKEYDGSQDHDLILRLTSKAEKIVHVPKLLYYWRSHAGSTAKDISVKSYAIDAAKGAVRSYLESKGYKNFELTSTRAFATIFKITYEIQGEPKISILIPNRNHVGDLKRCINSIIEKSTWKNYEIIVIENNSNEDSIFEYYKEIEKLDNVRVVKFTGEFNYSAVNNLGAGDADGDYILLLNNDTEVIEPKWMEELLMYAQRPDVACVGGKLLYQDNTVQHAGIVIGLGAHRTAGHTHYGISNLNYGYMGRLCYAQNVTAVTGACLMVKSAIYKELGGLDENFKISLNDVDFCLRARQLGYLNIFTPFAELYHYESISRGSDEKGKNAERYNKEASDFKEKWKDALEKGDPYYNPNFSLDRSDYSLRI